MQFKLKDKVGSHAETSIGADGKPQVTIYKAEDGYIFETDLELDKMFKNKFERVNIMTPEQLASAPRALVNQQAAALAGKKTEKSAFGVDVTDKFPTAAPDDLSVFRDGDSFTVVESIEPTKALNSKPLKESQVAAFIKKFLSE